MPPSLPRHADAVQELASHPDVLATTNLPEPYPDDGTEYPFAILNAEDTLVGVTGLRNVTDDRAEVGFWVGKPYWNQGYATAGTRRLLAFAFDELGLHEVFARPLKRNAPSRRVLKKLGFAAVSVETHEHPKWTEDDPVARYVLDRDEGPLGDGSCAPAPTGSEW